MTNLKSTKRALITSVVALFLCFAMLLGTTFAWFTDSVASGSNVIKTGNLDLVVEYTLDGETWGALDGANDLFQKGLWEPGHSEVVALRVRNNGSLALQYSASMNVVKEIIGKNVLGENIVLSQLLKVSTITQQVNDEGDALLEEAFSAADSLDKSNAGPFVTKGFAGYLAAGEAQYIIIMVDMPSTVGNEANHDGTNVPSIEFGINFLATQCAAEYDSFGNDYDDINIIYTAEQLKAAVAAGQKNIMLNNDIYMDVNGVAMEIPDGVSVSIDLNGHSIVASTTASNASQILFLVAGELTVSGKGGVILYNNSGAAFNDAYEDTAIMARGGVVTLNEGVTVVSDSIGGSMAYAVDVATWGGDAVLNVNGAVLTSSYIAVRACAAQAGNTATVNYNSGILQGDKKGYDLWKHDLGGGADAFKINVAAGISYEINTDWGIYLFDLDTVVVSNGDEAQDALDAAQNGTKFLLVPTVSYGTLQVRAQVIGENKAAVPANTNTEKVDYYTTKYPKGEFLRNFEDITITGAIGAKVDAIKFVTGSLTNVSGVSGTMYQFVNVKNLTIDSVEFTDDSMVTPDKQWYSPLLFLLTGVQVDGLTVKNCTLNGNRAKMNFVYAYGSTASDCTFEATLKNVVIANNNVNGIGRLCELRAAENVTIQNNTVSNLAREMALLANDAKTVPPYYIGTVTITGNTATNIATDYKAANKAGLFVRIGVGGDATVIVTNNVVANSGCVEDSFAVITDHTGILTQENNQLS